MEIPLLDAVDLEILMHRDVHFGGSFTVMLEYYEKEGVGAMPDYELSRIAELKIVEESLDKNLSETVLPMPAIEEIDRAKELYHKLRSVYEQKHEIPILLSDLILSEEEEPETEINALVSKGHTAVAPLIHLIESSDFYNPLFPGYGRAPLLAARCLAKIGDPKAIQPLFNALGQESFSLDEALISALVSLGEPAKTFLLKRLQHLPLSKDNEHAAIVLTSFPPDQDIALVAFSLLTNPEIIKRQGLASYLICCCEGLSTEESRQEFLNLTKSAAIPKPLQKECALIPHAWHI